MFAFSYNQALTEALNHASNNIKCAHLGCSLLINGEFHSSFQNDPLEHAEMNALSRLKENNYCSQ